MDLRIGDDDKSSTSSQLSGFTRPWYNGRRMTSRDSYLTCVGLGGRVGGGEDVMTYEFS